MLNKEERKKALKERESAYYCLDGDLDNIKWKLDELKKHRGHSRAFRMLIIAIELMQEQVRADYKRYAKRINEQDSHDDLIDLQKSFNRQVEKNKVLEARIEEAKTSSGLFIDFVRKNLGIK